MSKEYDPLKDILSMLVQEVVKAQLEARKVRDAEEEAGFESAIPMLNRISANYLNAEHHWSDTLTAADFYQVLSKKLSEKKKTNKPVSVLTPKENQAIAESAINTVAVNFQRIQAENSHEWNFISDFVLTSDLVEAEQKRQELEKLGSDEQTGHFLNAVCDLHLKNLQEGEIFAGMAAEIANRSGSATELFFSIASNGMPRIEKRQAFLNQAADHLADLMPPFSF